MWEVASHAEFDQYLNAPVPVSSVTQSLYCRIGLPTNLTATCCMHILSQFIITGLGTDSAGPGDIKSLYRSGPVSYVSF